MNNEEKILSMLETITQDVSDLKTDVSDLKERVTKIEITQENIIVPNIQTMAEAISSINKKLITRDEIDGMKEEIAFLKDIIRMHTSQINDLKKAQ